jgi:hypothetical protein
VSDEDVLRKLDQHLRAIVDDPRRQAETVPVVIRLRVRAEGATPADKERDFERRTRPLVERLETLGAEIVELLWIAGSISARIPVSRLGQAAADSEIDQLISDHPRKAL